MKYNKVTFDVPQGYERDLLIALLGEIGFESFETEAPDIVSGYVQQSLYNEEALSGVALHDYFEHMRPLIYRVEPCEDRDWNAIWEREYYKPLVVDRAVTVRASFHKIESQTPIEIIIDPKMAFGTGHHGTTASMMWLIKRVSPQGRTVIDMGCGSGILAIYALKLGAQRTVAIDFDERSVVNAKENAALNNVSLKVLHGDASILSQVDPVDLFMANINRNIILNDLDRYLHRLKARGDLLLSGFYTADVPMITEALKAKGLEVVEEVEDNNWVALHARRV